MSSIKIKVEKNSSAKKVLKELVVEIEEYLSENKEENPVEEKYNEDYAIINGIKLRRKNERLAYCEHFTFEEAGKIAAMFGGKVPTSGEWENMLATGSTWEEEKKGIWIGENHRLKKETNYSTFLPAAGNRDNTNGQLYASGIAGYYWSATRSGNFSFYLVYNSDNVIPASYNSREHGFSVRCVAE